MQLNPMGDEDTADVVSRNPGAADPTPGEIEPGHPDYVEPAADAAPALPVDDTDGSEEL